MENGKREATHELECIAALPYNPLLGKEAKEIQRHYRIPVGDKGLDWFFRDYLPKYRKCAYAVFTDKAIDPWFASSAANNLWHTEVPLEQDVLVLLGRFRIPLTLFKNVLVYILTDHRIWLDPCALRPKVRVDYGFNKGTILSVTITGLSPWATKKQWAEIWDNEVKQEVEIAKKAYCEAFGVAEIGKKRATLESYREQMERWSEWYQLSEVEGLGPTKALEKWEESHPYQRGKLDLSTLTHAIKEFQKIITPIPIKD